MDYGFRAVVSSRFADIFRNNCTKQGLLPVQVTEELDRALLDAVIADPVTGDHHRRGPGVDRGTGGRPVGHLPPRRVHPRRLLNGWDDIGLTLRYADDIDAYERGRPDFLPSASASASA